MDLNLYLSLYLPCSWSSVSIPIYYNAFQTYRFLGHDTAVMILYAETQVYAVLGLANDAF